MAWAVHRAADDVFAGCVVVDGGSGATVVVVLASGAVVVVVGAEVGTEVDVPSGVEEMARG